MVDSSLPRRASVTAVLLCLLGPAPPVRPQVYRERVEVGLVRVELFVRGSDGLPILDLKPSEVRLSVDGRPVAVDGLALASAPEAQPVAPGPTPSSPTEPSPSSAVAPARETSTDLIAIFVDETTTEQFNRNAVYAQLRRFLEDLPQGASALLQRFDGTLSVECPWTSDRQTLLQALERLQSRGTVPRLRSRESESFESDSQLSGMEARTHIRSSLAALYEAVLRFPMTEGRRRSLVFVTDGGPFQGQLDITRDLMLAPDSQASGMLQGSREARERELARERDAAGEGLARRRAWTSQLADVTRLATRREIALIPVRSASPEVGGFRGAHQSGEGVGAPPGSPSSGLTREESFAAWLAVNHGMSEVSELTGGEAVLTRGAFAHRMRRFLDDRAQAYVLTFRDPFPKDRRDHAISIELSRPRTTLRYRRSYRVGAVVESLTEDVITRLYDPAPRNPLGAAARIEQLRRERDVIVARMTIAYPVPPEAGGAAATAPRDVGMVGVCATRDGARSEPVRYDGKVRPVPGRGGDRVLFYFDVRIRPGTYSWSLAVTDGPTSITSYLNIESRLGGE